MGKKCNPCEKNRVLLINSFAFLPYFYINKDERERRSKNVGFNIYEEQQFVRQRWFSSKARKKRPPKKSTADLKEKIFIVDGEKRV